MWILSILPDWFLHGMLLAGILGLIAGTLLSMIPVIRQYQMPIKVVSSILVVFGLFLEGAMIDNQVWQARVKEVEAKLAKAEAASARENTKLAEKSAEKTAKVKERTVVVKQYIDREVTKYDKTCVIPKEFVKAHNDAAEGTK